MAPPNLDPWIKDLDPWIKVGFANLDPWILMGNRQQAIGSSNRQYHPPATLPPTHSAHGTEPDDYLVFPGFQIIQRLGGLDIGS